jgi:hypothetical protein
MKKFSQKEMLKALDVFLKTGVADGYYIEITPAPKKLCGTEEVYKLLEKGKK